MNTLKQKPAGGIGAARKMAKPIHFYCDAPEANSVHVMGDFNGWNPNADPMTRRVDGWWFIELELTHGYHQYLFLVDGKRVLDPRATGVGHGANGEEVSMIAVS